MTLTSSSTAAPKKLGKKALVMGASMAGLMAARVLSDYFENVTLLDRDTLPQQSAVRNGVPQGKHIHLLLIRGQQSLERFFPGFSKRLDETGSPTVHWMNDVSLYLSNGWLSRNDLNITTRPITRPNLEQIVRQELAKRPNVSFIDNCQVNSLVTDDTKTRLVGLNVSYRRGDTDQAGKSEVLDADVIVDATGRNSRLPDWLKTLGYAAPDETRVDSKMAYASCLFSKLSYKPDWKIIGVNAKGPDQPRAGTINIQENGQWMVTMVGYGNENHPPTDPDGFLAFAKSLPCPEIHEALVGATPITTISGYASTANVWRHYEHLKQLPTGLIVLGDAVCCFNPVYGQGMTTSALAAETLNDCLAKIASIESLGMSFQKRLAKVIANPWLLATAADFQFPATEGLRPGGPVGLAQGYLDRLMSIVHNDAQIASTFIKVMNMVESPMALFNPAMVMKVLARSVGSKPQKPQEVAIVGQ